MSKEIASRANARPFIGGEIPLLFRKKAVIHVAIHGKVMGVVPTIVVDKGRG